MQKRNCIRSLFTMLALPGLVVLAALAVAAVATILSGCQGRKEVDLPFETIKQSVSRCSGATAESGFRPVLRSGRVSGG